MLTNSTGLPDFLGELTLGKPIDEYCAWIQSDTSWGGAIELSILAKHFKICVNAIDVKSSRVDRYCTEYANKNVYLMYDGIHYDPLYVEYDSINLKFYTFDQTKQTENSLSESNTSSNSSNKNNSGLGSNFAYQVEQEFIKLSNILKQARAYTDDQSCVICGNCNEMFENFTQAIAHGKKTGHQNFQQH